MDVRLSDATKVLDMNARDFHLRPLSSFPQVSIASEQMRCISYVVSRQGGAELITDIEAASRCDGSCCGMGREAAALSEAGVRRWRATCRWPISAVTSPASSLS